MSLGSPRTLITWVCLQLASILQALVEAYSCFPQVAEEERLWEQPAEAALAWVAVSAEGVVVARGTENRAYEPR